MKLPMYIRKLIYKRRDNARRFLQADKELSEWLSGNGLSTDDCCGPYLDPDDSEGIAAYAAKCGVTGCPFMSAAVEEHVQRQIEAIKAAADVTEQRSGRNGARAS